MPPPNVSARPSEASQPPPPATRGDEDPMSPTVMIQSYLRSRGLPLNAQNVQRVLEMNARGMPNDPNSQNVVPLPGLVSDVPSSDPNVGGKGNVAGKIEQAPTRGGANLPTPPIPPGQTQTSDQANAPTLLANAPQTNIPLGALIASGTGAGLGYYLGGRRGTGGPGDIGDISGVRLADAGALNAPAGSQVQLTGPNAPADTSLPAPGQAAALPAPATQLPPPASVQTGDRFQLAPNEQGDPLQTAITRATQPPMIPGQPPLPQIPGAPPPAQLSYQPGVNGAPIALPNQAAIQVPPASAIPPQSTTPQITDQSNPPIPLRSRVPMTPEGGVAGTRIPVGKFGLPSPGARVLRGLRNLR